MEIKMLEVRSDRGVTRPVLIRDGGAALLADTGYPLTAEAVLSGMRGAGCDPEALTVIALTHQDIDHVGCAKDILARCPGHPRRPDAGQVRIAAGGPRVPAGLRAARAALRSDGEGR